MGGGHQFRIEHEITAPDAVLVGELAQVEETLAHLDLAFDDPIERAAVEHLVPAARRHARRVNDFAFFLEAAFLPAGQAVDAFGPDTEFDDVDGHALNLGIPGPQGKGVWRIIHS